MANSVWQGTVQDASGNIVTGAEISVYDEGTGTLATIYSDIGGTALTNPFFSDSNGFAQFYAAAGQYRITAVEAGSGLNQTFRHVRLGEAGSVDTGTDSDEVPKNSDLTDVLRDSDIGQTVAGLTSPGNTNLDSGNTNLDEFGGVGSNQIIATGFAETSTVAVFYLPISRASAPSSVTLTSTLSIKRPNLSTITTGVNAIGLATSTSNKLCNVFVTDLTGMTPGEPVLFFTETATSKIAVD